MLDTTNSSATDITSRLAVLEERTKPKPRTIFDVIKDWSGILTFVIAVLYTYPLGVWDRFVVTAKEQRTKELSELRSVILAVTTADMEAVRAYAAISDPSMQQQLILAANARKGTLLMPGLTLFQKHYESLTGAELVMLGYYVNQLGDQGELASKMLTKSAEKMVASKNSLAAADALRIKAQIYAPFGSLANLPKARQQLQESMGLLLASAEPQKSLQYAGAIAMDWTNIEAVAGDWACAEVLATWLFSQYQYSNPAYAEQLKNQFSQMATARANYLGSSTPKNQGSCPAAIIPWKVSGWPWATSN